MRNELGRGELVKNLTRKQRIAETAALLWLPRLLSGVA
jgi:hypothetical protein